MAKRKSTDKTAKIEEDNAVEAGTASDDTTGKDASVDTETSSGLLDPDAEAEKTPAEIGSDTSQVSDDVVELPEPDALKEGDPVDPDTDADAVEVIDSSADEAPDVNKDHLSEEEAERLLEEAETLEPSVKDHSDPAPEPTAERTDVPLAPQVIRETTVERKGGFGSMLVGGAVAAALGYGVAAYVSQDVWPFKATEDTTFETDMRAALSSQDSTLTNLAERVGALEAAEIPTVDLTPLQDQIAAVQSTASDLAGRLDDIAQRVDALERQPMEQAVSPEAIAAYERALDELQAEVEAQRAEVSKMAQEAVEAEGNAEEKAALAAARAALADITAALETGAGYADAVSILAANGVDVPAGLANSAETGVATQGGLIAAFPDAARAALNAARRDATEDAQGTSRIATFFANQLGARSVEPRDGQDADAILSRAEAAVRSGDLDTALTEIAALPEVAQSALADWQASAQKRLEAKTAADALVQQLLQ